MRTRFHSFAIVVAGSAVIGFGAVALRAEPEPGRWTDDTLSVRPSSGSSIGRASPARDPAGDAGPAFVIEAGERPIGEWVVRCRTDAVRVRGARMPDGRIVSPSESAAEAATCDDRDSPVAAVRQLFAAYSLREPALLVESLADDFLFTSDDPEFVAAWPHGMTRAEERNFVTKIADGGRSSTGVALPPVIRMRVRIAGFEIDPAPENAEHARVIARGVECEMYTAEGLLGIEAADQTFDLVRTAAPSESPLAGLFASGAWRIRAWHEVVTKAAAVATSAASADVEPTRLVLGIRRLSGPREWPVELAIAMPHPGNAHFELFDVAGRLRMDRVMEAAGPGILRLTIADRDVRAGCYFARVRSGNEVVTSRVVVMR